MPKKTNEHAKRLKEIRGRLEKWMCHRPVYHSKNLRGSITEIIVHKNQAMSDIDFLLKEIDQRKWQMHRMRQSIDMLNRQIDRLKKK